MTPLPPPAIDLGSVSLVAIDLDGTLLGPDGRVSHATATAVERARRAGLTLVAATGRPPMMLGDSLSTIVDSLHYAVGSNGSIIARFPGAEVMRIVGFDADLARAAVITLRRIDPAFGFALATDAGFVHEPGFSERMPAPLGSPASADVLALGGAEAYKLLVFHPEIDAHRLVDEIPGLLTASDGSPTDIADALAVGHMGADAVELGPTGVDKGSGLVWLCDQIGVEADDVLAIGDDWNDLSMLAWAGTAVAVANADRRVRAVADLVAPSNAEDGVAWVLDAVVAAR